MSTCCSATHTRIRLPVACRLQLLAIPQRSHHAISGVHAAGLPRLLVDVRHEASHNDMPSLSLLRLAAAQALDWLQAAYWQRQEAYLQQQKGRVVQLLQVVEVPNMHVTLALEEHCSASASLTVTCIPLLPLRTLGYSSLR